MSHRAILLFRLAAAPLFAADYAAPAGVRPAARRPGAESILPGGRIVASLGQQYTTGPGPFGLADRKSTRLNSSHANISYAVFCLKKKKNTAHVTYRPLR